MTPYEEIDALNWSSIKHAATSGLMYRHRTRHREPDKPQFGLGRAYHALVFEPETFDARFVCYRDGKRDKRHKAYQAFLAEVPDGAVVLTPAEWDKARAIADAVRSSELVRPYLSGGEAEATLEWSCPLTDVRCKGRVDYLSDRVVDLKGTTDVGERATARAYADYLYHGQVAMYHNGAISAGRILALAPPPVVIWVEKEPPFDVAVDEFTLDDLAAGEACFVELIERVKRYGRANVWPGKAPEPRRPNIPPYALGAREEEF